MKISKVTQNSIAEQLEIREGDDLVSVNGVDIIDIIDYNYEIANDTLRMRLLDGAGEPYEAYVEKEEHEDIGLEFVHDGFDQKTVCRNKCLFCFVDQLPKGMRKTLYFKDDDWRMSFLMGSYITLTNLTQQDIARIIKYKTSPLYVSVHASDDAVRTRLLGAPAAKSTMDIIKLFAENEIKMHTQIVLCPGINDGQVLEKTIEDLYGLFPAILSVAVVPVGLTQYSKIGAVLRPVEEADARSAIALVERMQHKCLDETGSRFVFAADEMYIKARADLPGCEEYEDFPQIENGVGMVVKFLHETKSALREYSAEKSNGAAVAVATGVDFYPYMQSLCDAIHAQYGSKVRVYPIENRFFGETVTVTGLLTGRDIINQLKNVIGEDILLLSGSCFKEDEDIMLDDIDVPTVEAELGVKCSIVHNDGYHFVQQFIDR